MKDSVLRHCQLLRLNAQVDLNNLTEYSMHMYTHKYKGHPYDLHGHGTSASGIEPHAGDM